MAKAQHKLSNTKLHVKWRSMKKRCFGTQYADYKHYGGRGITVCDEWCNDFMAFYDWAMANGYQEGLTLDRIDNNGNYEPINCRWTNYNVQRRNTRCIKKTNTSGFRGVCYHKKWHKWVTGIRVNSKSIHIGYYETAVSAAFAYDSYVVSNELEHTTNFKIQNINGY